MVSSAVGVMSVRPHIKVSNIGKNQSPQAEDQVYYDPPKIVIIISTFVSPFFIAQLILAIRFLSDGSERHLLILFSFMMISVTVIFGCIAYIFKILQVGAREINVNLFVGKVLEKNQIHKDEYLKEQKKLINALSNRAAIIIYIVLLSLVASPSFMLFSDVLSPAVRGDVTSELSWLQTVAAGALVLLFGVIVFWSREMRAWRGYGYVEAVAGILIAMQCFRAGHENPLLRLIALVGGLRVFVDGLKRIREFHPRNAKIYNSLSEYYFASSRYSSKKIVRKT